MWTRVAKDPQPFNLYMFRGNNPISKVHHIKEYVTGGTIQQLHPCQAAGPDEVAVLSSLKSLID